MNYTSSEPSYNLSATKDCSFPLAQGVALISVNSFVGGFGTLGNLLVCVAVATNSRLRQFPNYLLFSLAIADLIITMLCEPVVIAILSKRTFQNLCADNLERVFFIVSNFSASASVVHLSAISVDRLLAVVCPLRHKGIMENFGWKSMLVVCWTLPVGILLSSRFVPAPVSVKAFVSLAVFVLFYGIVFVSYTLIVISLVKQRKRVNEINATSPADTNPRREIRVAVTLAIVVVVFTACWFPLFVVLAVAGKPLVKIQGTAHMWIRTLALSNSAMNFIIYGSRMRNFSDTYKEIFQKILRFAGL